MCYSLNRGRSRVNHVRHRVPPAGSDFPQPLSHLRPGPYLPFMTRLEIVSDPVCPWCYIGASFLMRALLARPAHPFVLTWRPYQLNPDLPHEGMDRRAYLEAKFGGAENVRRIHDRIGAVAEEAGLHIDWDRIGRAPNTLDAHRVLRWAAAEGVQTPVKMALFTRYFGLGEDISDPEVLAGAASDAGMEAAVVARLLAGDTDREAVRAEAEHFRAMGVTGVPTFIIGGRYVVSGAQRPEFWNDLMDKLDAAAEEAGSAALS